MVAMGWNKGSHKFHLLQSPLLFLSLLCVLSPFSPARLFVTPWTVAHQVPLKMRFSRPYSESPCPPPGDLSDPWFELISLTTPALAGGFFTTSTPGKPNVVTFLHKNPFHSRLWLRNLHSHFSFQSMILRLCHSPFGSDIFWFLAE